MNLCGRLPSGRIRRRCLREPPIVRRCTEEVESRHLAAEWNEAVAEGRAAWLEEATLGAGSVLYRRWCLQCHGPTGAGDGARHSSARDADYRQGLFKFITAFPPQAGPGSLLPEEGAGPAAAKPRGAISTNDPIRASMAP